MTQPGEKVPEMASAPTAPCIMDTASVESRPLLCSPGLNPPGDVGGLRQIPPEDPAKSLAQEPEKGTQEAQNQKANHLPLMSQDKAPAGAYHKKERPSAPEVQQYFYQVNWPQEVVEKWAREKEVREKRLSVVVNQDVAAAAFSTLGPAPQGQNFEARG